MLNRTELVDKILVTVAEHYFIFNENNPNAITQFVEFYNSSSTLELTSLPEHIGLHWEPFEHHHLNDLFAIIDDHVSSLLVFIQNGLTLNYFDCLHDRLYFKSDIKPIDPYILECVRRYNILHGLSELGVDFNIEIETFEKWLIKQWGLNQKPYDLNKIKDLFISKIAARFNATKDELNSSGDYRYCFWVCFLEEMKLKQIDAEILLYCEGVLCINKEIFDVLDELPP